MRIDSISLTNYRQYSSYTYDFKKPSNGGLHIIIGENGTGKSNILNAINWCLYETEPHLSKKSHQLPILNLKADKIDKESDIKVEITIASDDGQKIIFSRAQRGGGKGRKSNLEVKKQTQSGPWEIFEGEQAESMVNKFIPFSIKEYFFFDGEQLNNYFRDLSGAKVMDATLKISNVGLIDNVLTRLDTIKKEKRRLAGSNAPKIKELEESLEELEREYKDTISRIDSLTDQISINRNTIRECNENLDGLPDLEELREEEKSIDVKYNEKQGLLNSKNIKKHQLLFKGTTALLLNSTLHKAKEILDDARVNKIIPPPVPLDVLEEIVKNRVCKVCKSKLDKDSIKRIEDILSKTKYTSDAVFKINTLDGYISELFGEAESFEKELKILNSEMKLFEDELKELEDRKKDIEHKLSVYDNESVRMWNEQLRYNDEQLEDNIKNKGKAESERDRFKIVIKRKEQQLEIEIDREDKVSYINSQIKLMESAHKVLIDSKAIVMNSMRKKIERRTREVFFELLWKKDTYAEVKIDENYNTSLIHKSGYECLGTVSAGERQLLALAFTLALHEVSGFSSPLIIDTPVGRISGKNRENFGKTLLEVSNTKQVFLLFIPDEYSKNINQVLDGNAKTKHVIGLTKDELEASVEVYYNELS